MCNKKPSVRVRATPVVPRTPSSLARAREIKEIKEMNPRDPSGLSRLMDTTTTTTTGESRVYSQEKKKKTTTDQPTRYSRRASHASRRLPLSRPSLPPAPSINQSIMHARSFPKSFDGLVRLYTTDHLSRGTPLTKTRFTIRHVRIASAASASDRRGCSTNVYA